MENVQRLKEDVFNNSIPLDLKKLRGRGEGKSVRATSDERHRGNGVFQTRRNWHSDELTETVAAHIRYLHTHTQATQGPRADTKKQMLGGSDALI